MRRTILTLPLAILAIPAAAETEPCADLGLANTYLTALFCEQIGEISGGGTRSLGDPDDLFGDDPPDWAGIEPLREAYRVDPQKTLDLIQRIRNAGGLPPPG